MKRRDRSESDRLMDLMFASNRERTVTRRSGASLATVGTEASGFEGEEGEDEWRRRARARHAETRIDPSDGKPYTRDEFVREYGPREGATRWKRAGEVELRVDPVDGRPYDRAAFSEEYGAAAELGAADPADAAFPIVPKEPGAEEAPPNS